MFRLKKKFKDYYFLYRFKIYKIDIFEVILAFIGDKITFTLIFNSILEHDRICILLSVKFDNIIYKSTFIV